MLPAVALGLSLLFSPQQPECPDVSSCRQAALEAAARGEYETFHDLAWRAVQKGKPNDPELMKLVSRAQSLSGRPGDALVMLRRLAQMGIATDAATSDDFRRVRALPGWPEVETLVEARAKLPSAPDAADPPAPAPAPTAPKSNAAGKVSDKAAAIVEDAKNSVAGEDEGLPPSLASIQPAGLAHDGVSRRFIVGDRRENKLVIFDDVFKRATDMVAAASAGFSGLSAVEIDHRRGDLCVVNSAAEQGASLHKLQLISGRVLFQLDVPTELGAVTFVDAAVLPDGQVLVLDALGRRLLGVAPSKREFLEAAAIDVEGLTSIAHANGHIYVAHRGGVLRVDLAGSAAAEVRNAPPNLLRIRSDRGALVGVQSTDAGYRIVRLRLDGAGRKVNSVDVLDRSLAMPDPSGIVVVDGVVCYIAAVEGGMVMRRVKIRR